MPTQAIPQPDRLDQALAIGGGFDWITPVLSLLGGGKTYKVQACAWPQELSRLQREGKSPRHVNQTGEWVVYDL
jgi:hypothetical protein